MTHMDDADSSSAGLSDVEGPQMHEIEIGVPNESTGRKVRDAVDALAFDLEALVEFEDDEDGCGRVWRQAAGPAMRVIGRRTRLRAPRRSVPPNDAAQRAHRWRCCEHTRSRGSHRPSTADRTE